MDMNKSMIMVVESLPMLGMCSLCLNIGAVRNMFIGYKHDNGMEFYSQMLKKCFSIDISELELGDSKRLICETCIVKLRAAVAFRVLVEQSLSNLEESAKNIKNEDPIENDTIDNNLGESAKSIKEEDTIGSNFDDGPSILPDDDDDFKDDEVIKKIIKKEVRDKYKTRKTKKSHSRPLINFLKKQDYTETDAMLNSGLFPFKFRKNLFSCTICQEKSSSLDDLKSHVTNHSKKNIHLAFKKMIYSNSQRFYKSSTCLRCKICTTDVKNFDELKQHNDNCTRLKPGKWNNLPFKLEKDQLDCPVCKKTFLNYVSLNTHMNVHYPNYICENCGKAFASKARLRGHMRTHEVGEFSCKYCDAVFDRVTKRENHVSKEHKAGVRYACKKCNISLSSFYARQKHLAEIHNEELKRYKCKVCPQSYITPGHLSSHVRRDHLNERNHKCDKCDLAFYTRNALKMHMIKHDGERIHVCHICQKSYQRKKTLREHMRIHNNDKRFICPVCGRAFTQKCTLKGHLKVHERKLDVEYKTVEPLHSI